MNGGCALLWFFQHACAGMCDLAKVWGLSINIAGLKISMARTGKAEIDERTDPAGPLKDSIY